MASLLSCGPEALVSCQSAGWLWGLCPWSREIHIVVPNPVTRRRPGVCLHRRLARGDPGVRRIDAIPVTSPLDTIVDLARELPRAQLERAIREADRLDLVDPATLRTALDGLPRRPGVGVLRKLLDSETLSLTESELERRFFRLVQAAGLPMPRTQVWLNGYRVDFYWPDLGLVVETDGLRYHRTASQQKRDRIRDQAHAAAGLTTLRFTAAQVRDEPEVTRATLAAVMARLRSIR
jgi:very-short-patch-repair endonuclease